MKKCSKCNQDKEYSNFYKKSSSKDGCSHICKGCRIEYNNNSKDLTQRYYKKNKEKYQESSKKYYKTNTEKVKNNSTKWQKHNHEEYKLIQKKWHKNNREYHKVWRKDKWDNDPNYKLRILLGNRLNEVLKKNKTYKSSNIIALLDCSLGELKSHLQQLFKKEMSWINHGIIWEIDHIIPCANFNLSLVEEQKKCFHFSNLQPLFKTTKISKSFGYDSEIGNRNKSDKFM